MCRKVLLKGSAVTLLCLSIIAGFVTPGVSETIILTSGLAAVGFPDPTFTYLAGPPVAPLSGAPFTAADFAAALTGPPAIVVAPFGPWVPGILCEPMAKWIAVSPGYGPASALFGTEFDVMTCCILSAKLDFCWSADDYLGDALAGGPNPSGVYINGVPLPISGGSFATESFAGIDITPFIHCGVNTLHVYDRDGAAVVSGAIFKASIRIIECTVPTRDATWGGVKALYR